MGFALFSVLLTSLFYFHATARTAQIEVSRSSLARTAAFAATSLDGDLIDSVIGEGRGDTPRWERAVTPLRKLLKLTGDVRYAYFMRLDGDSIRFVLDASPKGDLDHDGIDDFSPMGSTYEWAAPELYTALREGTRQVDMRLIRDPWGLFLSAYAPIRNSEGRLVGVVGIDLDATEWVASLNSLKRAFAIGAALGLLSSILAGLGVYTVRKRTRLEAEETSAEDSRYRAMMQQFSKDLEARIQARTADLQQANTDLQKALRTREAFLATANHELRTPLQSLLASAEMLGQGFLGPLSPGQERRVGTIRRCGRHLLDLITQVLDLSRARSGTVELFKERMDLRSICEETLEILSDEIDESAALPQVTIPEEARWVEADALRLRQILLNLFGNALKFTPSGGTITIDTESVSNGRGVLMTVTDTGPGIPEDIREGMFRSLDDVAILRNSDQKLGLPLAAWLASLQGGSLRYEPAPGGGSRFRLQLPVGIDSETRGSDTDSSLATVAEEVTRPLASAMRVLIAEDNPDIRETLCEYLEAKGCEVYSAANGREAVEAARATTLDLVLMDLQMPELDGLEATRLLRAEPGMANLPIVVMTAFASGEDAVRCREAGATSYVPKPLELRRLGRILTEFAPAEPS